MSDFVRPVEGESADWIGIYRGPDNQWRCQHLRPSGRKCNRLLAVNDEGVLHAKRGDYEIRVIDFKGSATGIKCTECARWNWILSNGITEADISELIQRIKS